MLIFIFEEHTILTLRNSPHGNYFPAQFISSHYCNGVIKRVSGNRFSYLSSHSIVSIITSTSPLKIILADDDPDDTDLFKEAISKSSAVIHLQTVEDGEQLMKALKVQSASLPDLVFLDLNMPKKNGMDCLKEIRNNLITKALPVIIFSTSSSINDVNETYTLGANLYLKKPDTFKELVEFTSKVVSFNWTEHKPYPDRAKFILSSDTM